MTRIELDAATDAVLLGLEQGLVLVPPEWIRAPMTRAGAEAIALDVLRAFNRAHGRTLQLNYERDMRRKQAKQPKASRGVTIERS